VFPLIHQTWWPSWNATETRFSLLESTCKQWKNIWDPSPCIQAQNKRNSLRHVDVGKKSNMETFRFKWSMISSLKYDFSEIWQIWYQLQYDYSFPVCRAYMITLHTSLIPRATFSTSKHHEGVMALRTLLDWYSKAIIVFNLPILKVWVPKNLTIKKVYYPTKLVIVQKLCKTSTNIPWYYTVGYCTVQALILLHL